MLHSIEVMIGHVGVVGAPAWTMGKRGCPRSMTDCACCPIAVIGVAVGVATTNQYRVGSPVEMKGWLLLVALPRSCRSIALGICPSIRDPGTGYVGCNGANMRPPSPPTARGPLTMALALADGSGCGGCVGHSVRASIDTRPECCNFAPT